MNWHLNIKQRICIQTFIAHARFLKSFLGEGVGLFAPRTLIGDMNDISCLKAGLHMVRVKTSNVKYYLHAANI